MAKLNKIPFATDAKALSFFIKVRHGSCQELQYSYSRMSKAVREDTENQTIASFLRSKVSDCTSNVFSRCVDVSEACSNRHIK